MTLETTISEESVTPDIIFEMFNGIWVTAVLKAGVALDIFTRIAEGYETVDAIAKNTETSRRGTRILLNALCGLELLTKTEDRYNLTPVTNKFLVKGKETYIGGFSSAIPLAHWEAFGKMAEAVKKGTPVFDFISHESEAWEEVALSLIPLGVPVAQALCKILGIGEEGRTALKVLDVACGSGVYGYILLQQDPRARVVGLDRQNVLNVAWTVAQSMGVADRVIHRAGDILTMEYGDTEFDIAIVSHILQGFGPIKGRSILKKVYEALVPEGMVVINDFVADEERFKKKYPLLFATYMLLVTPEGDTYTFSEFKTWLEAIGFENVTEHDVTGESSLIIATKGRILENKNQRRGLLSPLN
ncbi:MAG: methyltransferase dimerization domain-containing protein [Candidatus Hodarchaeota archaeon]